MGGQVSLPSVGTGWHTLQLNFQGNRIRVTYDGSLVIDVTDDNYDGRPAAKRLDLSRLTLSERRGECGHLVGRRQRLCD